jgi:sirohydrochlorin cobaltochelatase
VREVVLLVAHGSRNPTAADEHARLCAEVAKRSGGDVRAAYLEIDAPSVLDAIGTAADHGATRIRLIPYFLHHGNHVGTDLPALVDEARRLHPGVAIGIEDHIGSDPALVDLLAGRVSTDPQ